MSRRLVYRKRYERPAHSSRINVLAFNPQGTFLAIGGADGYVSVLSVDSGDLLCHINARSPISSLIWSSTDDGLLFGCRNGLLVSARFDETSVRATFLYAHRDPLECLTSQPKDGNIVSGACGEVIVWKRGRNWTQEESWETLQTVPHPPMFTNQPPIVTSLNWNSDGELLVSYKWHGLICWQLSSATIIWRISMDQCETLSLSSNRSLAAAYSPHRGFEVYDLTHRRFKRAMHWAELDRSRTEKLPVVFAHGDFAVVGGSFSGRVSVWDVEQGDILFSLDHGADCPVGAIATFFQSVNDRFMVLTGTDDGRVFLWDTVPDESAQRRDDTNQIPVRAQGVIWDYLYGFRDCLMFLFLSYTLLISVREYVNWT
ncbi:WD40 repeat-like protein [Artomyces pyxidatus]|uniref:WD40 repeat-like protein n=1 Tax=Artomyces pyxidatus TaxID=48021 RepID=A0ACB8SG69_9AGAM|nr:WD40 repeat-like protein [Artomyces pyxidatus]